MVDGRSLAASLHADGNFFDATHFPDNTSLYFFRDEVCYLIMYSLI